MKQTKQLLLANQAWALDLLEENPDFFLRQVKGEKPQFLWIGCSDSRVSPEQMTSSQPGGMFIHRNIANLVRDDDLNLMSVIQYAVDVLEVPNVIICGHHGCSGIRDAMAGGLTGPVDRWLQTARDVIDNHRDELDAQASDDARVDRLVEVNVRDQLINLARTETVQKVFASGRELVLHGWVYDILDGLLKPLMTIDATTDLDTVDRPDPVLV